MTETTPGWGLPYPKADTLITDSAAIVQELAEKIDAALGQVTPSTDYTVPGTLLADFVASGVFEAPDRIRLVNVAIVGGGGRGGNAGNMIAAGGAGGQVVVYRDVPVTNWAVPVSIGVSDTGTSFGPLSALPGGSGLYWIPGRPQNPFGTSIGGSGRAGGIDGPRPGAPDGGAPTAGPTINGTTYAGGGGGFNKLGAEPFYYENGAVGGGGRAYSISAPATNGVTGMGGGGGAGNSGNPGPGPGGAGLGGSGRVLIWTEQDLTGVKVEAITPPTFDPVMFAWLDESETMTGVYAMHPDAGAEDVHADGFVIYPDAPVDTGRLEEGVPVLMYPSAGWKYTNNKWEAPNV